MRLGFKSFKFKRLIEPLGLTGGKNPNWSLWIEVRDQTYRSHDRQERAAEGLLRMPLVQCAMESIDPEQTFDSDTIEGLNYPMSEKVNIKEICSLTLTLGDRAAANWLLRQVGQERIEQYLQALGCKSSRLAGPFRDPEGAQATDNYTCLRDAMKFLQISGDQTDQARWLKRSRVGRYIADWMPETLDVWSQGGIFHDTVYNVAIIGDRPRWRIGYIALSREDPEVSALHIAHQAMRVRQALITEELVKPGD